MNGWVCMYQSLSFDVEREKSFFCCLLLIDKARVKDKTYI